jgi:catechol 2,3-dioxygenase-like lactoylglutathione lyase family enzyme
LHEICIGTTDLLPQISYWEQFGYRVGPIGELNAEQAQALYGVNSKLRGVRLLHQDSDHGLIRLWQWEKPVNEGLGLARLIQPGSRWTSTLTRDVMSLYNHAQAAQRAGKPIHVVTPQWSEIYKLAQSEPFTGDIIGVRELIVLQPLVRHMFFQRFGYDAPKYGKVNEAAKFRTSHTTHNGLVYASDDPELPKFYRDVLGLQLAQYEQHNSYESLDEGSRNLYDLKPGEFYFGSVINDPRNGPTPDTAVSGRVLLRRVPLALKQENLIERSRPGSLGYSLYTYRVADLAAYHAKVKASKATMVTDVIKNEFGESSFAFRAPDGHSWALVGK